MQGSDLHASLLADTRCAVRPTAITLRRLRALAKLPGVRLVHTDTGRDHAPGNLAGVIRFYVAQHDRAAVLARAAQLPVHVHAPRAFYCPECEVIHADSTDCRA